MKSDWCSSRLGWMVIGVLATAMSGCAVGRGPARIDSDDPAVQLPAMVGAGEQEGKDKRKDLPALVDALDDEDAAVRLFAIESLEILTGETLGYQYYGSPRARSAAIGRWREYLATGQVPPIKPPVGPATTHPSKSGGVPASVAPSISVQPSGTDSSTTRPASTQPVSGLLTSPSKDLPSPFASGSPAPAP